MNIIIFTIIEYLKLLRIKQWYKNLVIFLPLFFVGQLLSIGSVENILIGFIALCLVSSANYIINDITDKKSDRAHPEKKTRPIASGAIPVIPAGILALILLAISILIALPFGLFFVSSIMALFLFTLAYSFFLKNEPILDIVMIAINFVIRAVSGVFIINVLISPWLIICPFFIAIFLAVGKRDADLKFLDKEALNHKKVLKFYNQTTTNGLMIIATTCLLMAYSLYAFSKSYLLLLTLPFAVYALFRYYSLVNEGAYIARHPENVYQDWRLTLALSLWTVLLFVIFYLLPNSEYLQTAASHF
jgi:4-hydroxybenzoate polyprenyltransferase